MDEPHLEHWRSAIGWNADYYLQRFPRIAKAGGWAPGWNMAAFLHSTGWLFYRRMFGWALLNFIAPLVLLFAVIVTAGALAPRANLDTAALVIGMVYLFAVFVLMPLFADSIYYQGLKRSHADPQSTPRPPSAWTALGGIALGVLWVAVIAAMMIPAYGGYAPRAKISEAILAASATRTQVGEFYAENRRLPQASEAGRFRADQPPNWVESIQYQAAERRILVTLRNIQPGKRFALYAQERGGELAWTCRTVDLEKKYLPASCRD